MKRITPASALALALATFPAILAPPASAQQVTDSVNVDLKKVWADPEFRKYFLGQYGISPDVEPRMSPEDRTVLEKVLPLMGPDHAGAAKLLAEAAARPEATPLFELILGNMAFQQDRPAEAATRFQAAVTRFPNFRRAWRMLGLTQMRQAEYDGAIKSFTKMIELGGGDATSYGLLGFAYSSKADHLAAETAYRNALLLDPQNSQWRLGLARSVVQQEKYEEAAALLRVLIERDPSKSEFWLLQANAYMKMGQPLRAAENLEVVARMDKGTPDAMNLLGDIYVNENKPDLAAAAYVKAIDLDPAQSTARAFRSLEALASRGANAEARQVADRMEAAFKDRLGEDDRRRILKVRARVASGEGNGDEAARVLAEIVALDPFDGDALVLLGQHYARAGELEKAAVYFERAANLEAFEPQAKLRLGQVMVQQAKYSEALPLLRRSQELKASEDLARYIEQVERLARTAR